MRASRVAAGTSLDMPQRLLALDALRGVAAMCVVLWHFTTRYGQIFAQPRPSLSALNFLALGVVLFFIISGFVILMSLEKTERASDFIVSRFARLYPAYWVAVILTFSVVTIFALPGRQVSAGTAAVNLTMLQSFVGAAHVDGVYWTLGLELTFYAVMLVLRLLKLLGRIQLIGVIWLVVAQVTYALRAQFGYEVPLSDIFLLSGTVGFFIAGMMFYLMRTGRGKWYTNLIVLLAFLVQAGQGNWQYKVAIALFFALFYALVYDKLGLIVRRPLLFLGAISYPLYLIHQNIGFVILRWLYSRGVHTYAAILCVVVVVLLLATGMAFLVERPARKAIRRRYADFSVGRRARRGLA